MGPQVLADRAPVLRGGIPQAGPDQVHDDSWTVAFADRIGQVLEPVAAHDARIGYHAGTSAR